MVASSTLPADSMEPALNVFSDPELADYARYAVELGRTGHPYDLEILSALERYPVSVEEFVVGEEYLGLQDAIYPEVLRALVELNNPRVEGLSHGIRVGSTYSEAVLTGAIGVAKSTIAIISTAYQVYVISCLDDPQAVFRLDPASEILFVFQSINAALAKQVDYERFKAMIEGSPYFRQTFPFDINVKSELRFPHRVIVRPVSGLETATIGQNVFGGCFPPDQQFLTADGRLENFRNAVGKSLSVLTPSPRGFTKSPTTRVVCTGEKPLVRLHLENGDSITCTPDQKFKGMVDEWIDAEHATGRHLRFTGMQTLRQQGLLLDPTPVERPYVSNSNDLAIGGEKAQVKWDDQLRRYPSERGHVRCVRVEQLTGNIQQVFDVENAGPGHTFLVASGPGFLHAKNCLDEVNYMEVVNRSRKSVDGDTYDQAIALYHSIARRRKSRFMRQGRLPGLLCLVSSKRYPGQFTDHKEAEARREMAEKGSTSIYVYDKRTWDIKPAGTFTGEWFSVFAGDQYRKPRMLAPGESMEGEDRRLIVDIPVEYKTEFEGDIMKALRDIAGVSTMAIHPFMMDTEAVSRCFGARDSILSRPDTDFDRTELILYPELIEDPKAPRFAHVDLALTGDSAGIVVGYVPRFAQIDRGDETETLPHIHIDFALEVRPPVGGEILIWRIRELFYKLREKGMNLCWITYDGFQSADSIQILRSKGFMTGIRSVDKTATPYEMTKTALYDERVELPDHPKLLRELVTLELDTQSGRIDHPMNGSKDVADALAGVVYGLTMRREVWVAHGAFNRPIPMSVRRHLAEETS